jgi:hypothetical protein
MYLLDANGFRILAKHSKAGSTGKAVFNSKAYAIYQTRWIIFELKEDGSLKATSTFISELPSHSWIWSDHGES